MALGVRGVFGVSGKFPSLFRLELGPFLPEESWTGMRRRERTTIA